MDDLVFGNGVFCAGAVCLGGVEGEKHLFGFVYSADHGTGMDVDVE